MRKEGAPKVLFCKVRNFFFHSQYIDWSLFCAVVPCRIHPSTYFIKSMLSVKLSDDCIDIVVEKTMQNWIVLFKEEDSEIGNIKPITILWLLFSLKI